MSAIDKVTVLTIAVRDQDEALRWYVEKLHFEKRSDVSAPDMRWLTIAPRKQMEVEFVLASWVPELVGKNAPWVMETQGCQDCYQLLVGRGVIFSQPPTEKPYGIEAVFHDLYGNTYALLERS
jgi:uncharacterized glyoxalase superfamily protein PhnB